VPLSLPYELRFGLIRDGALFTKVIRTFVRTVFAWQRRKAKALGYPDGTSGLILIHFQRVPRLQDAADRGARR